MTSDRVIIGCLIAGAVVGAILIYILFTTAQTSPFG